MAAIAQNFTDLDLQLLLSGNVPTAKVISGQVIPIDGGTVVAVDPPPDVIGMFISIHPRFISAANGAFCTLEFPDIQGSLQQVFLGGNEKFFLLGNFNVISQTTVQGNFAVGENASILFF